MDYIMILIIILLISIMLALIILSKKINKQVIINNVSGGIDNAKEKYTGIKNRLIWYKKYSPQTLGLLGFVIFTFFCINYLDRSFLFMYFMCAALGFAISKPLFKWLLEFTLLFVVDLDKNPAEVEIYEVSYRVRDNYKLLDDDKKPSILSSPFKCRLGKGFFVNSINKSKTEIIVSPFHNNIEIVQNIKDAIMIMRKKAVQLLHANSELRANLEIRSQIRAVQILEKTHAITKIAVDIENAHFDDLNDEQKRKELVAIAKRYLEYDKGVDKSAP